MRAGNRQYKHPVEPEIYVETKVTYSLETESMFCSIGKEKNIVEISLP